MITPDYEKALQIDKFQAMEKEMPIAARLVAHGIKDLTEITPDNDFYFLPMLEISQGLERLFKLMLCFEYHDTNGDYPRDSSFFKKYGHNLSLLFSDVKEQCLAYLPEEDMSFLSYDDVLCQMIEILGVFASSDRYYNLNTLAESECKERPKSPDDLWMEMEGNLLKSLPELQEVNNAFWESKVNANDVYLSVSRILFDRFYKLVMLLFTFFVRGSKDSKRRLHSGAAFEMRAALISMKKAYEC